MITITKMIETCGGCPSQWDGWDEEGSYFYFRYRWGFLQASSHDPDGRSASVFENQIGDDLDGVMSYAALKYHLKETFEFPEFLDLPDQVGV